MIYKRKFCYLGGGFQWDGFLFTRLNCSSCSVSSSTAWVCFCLISWTWASWVRVSSSRALFSTVTSCSRFALEGDTRQWSSSSKEHSSPAAMPVCWAWGHSFLPLVLYISIPELLLGGCGIQSILKLCLKSLQLFTKVSLLLFCFVSCSFFRLQVFLEIRNYRFQFTDLLEGVVLVSSFIFKPFWKKNISF